MRPDIDLRTEPDTGATTSDELLDMLHALRPAWHADAACRGQVDVMFPTTTQGRRPDWDAAKALCERCPVRRQCAEQGRNEAHGVWGGFTRDRSTSNRSGRERNCFFDIIQTHGPHLTQVQIEELSGTTMRTTRRRLAQLAERGWVTSRLGADGLTREWTAVEL